MITNEKLRVVNLTMIPIKKRRSIFYKIGIKESLNISIYILDVHPWSHSVVKISGIVLAKPQYHQQNRTQSIQQLWDETEYLDLEKYPWDSYLKKVYHQNRKLYTHSASLNFSLISQDLIYMVGNQWTWYIPINIHAIWTYYYTNHTIISLW